MTAATSPARPRRIGGRVLNAFSVTGTVTAIDPVAAHMRRVRIEGDEVARLAWVPGQQVRVHVSDVLDPHSWRRPRDILRTYSVWRYDGALELCVLDHDTGGPGARWARELRTGQPVTFGRPAAASASLLEAARRLELPREPGAVYLAGEARTVQSLRRHFVAERGWPRQAVRSKPFWAPGKRGLD